MRAAVLGSPVAHSLSPVLHSAAHAQLGLDDWTYTRREVRAEELPAVLASLGPEWGGLSLTMPLKQVVLPLLARTSPLALEVGAVNTLLPLRAGARQQEGAQGGALPWRGENTDVHGIVSALWEAGAERASSAAVLGGGATAASALAALRQLGVREPVVHVRSPLRASALQEVAARLGVEPHVEAWERAGGVLDADVVVSTVPAGAADGVAELLARPGAPRPRGVLLDVVYTPWPTRLAQVWAAHGGTVVGGFVMLLHQAGEQVRLMTGSPPPLEAMREAGEAALAARRA